MNNYLSVSLLVMLGFNFDMSRLLPVQSPGQLSRSGQSVGGRSVSHTFSPAQLQSAVTAAALVSRPGKHAMRAGAKGSSNRSSSSSPATTAWKKQNALNAGRCRPSDWCPLSAQQTRVPPPHPHFSIFLSIFCPPYIHLNQSLRLKVAHVAAASNSSLASLAT